MGFIDKGIAHYGNVSLGTLTTSGANETTQVPAPSGILPALLSRYKLTERFGLAEAWEPVGIWWQVTTGITVTAAIVTLRKNGVSALTGGTATLPIQAIDLTRYYFAPFADYTFAAADLAADRWSVLVTTTSTAGVVNPVILVYAVHVVPGVNVGVAQ